LIPYGAPFKCHAARFLCVFQARSKVKIFSTLDASRGGAQLINVTLGQCSQSNQAGGGLSFLFSRGKPHIAVFNYEELYNPKSKHDSN